MTNRTIDGASEAEIESDLDTGFLMPTPTSSYTIFVRYRSDLAYHLSHAFSYGLWVHLTDFVYGIREVTTADGNYFTYRISLRIGGLPTGFHK